MPEVDNETLAYMIMAVLAVTLTIVGYFSLRYTRYRRRLHSGVGKRPERPVWKPFWFT